MSPLPEKIEFRFVVSRNYPRFFFHKYTSFKGFEFKIYWIYFQCILGE